jgi:hypothetical protein
MVGSSKALSFHWCFVFSCQPASSPVRRRGRDFGDTVALAEPLTTLVRSAHSRVSLVAPSSRLRPDPSDSPPRMQRGSFHPRAPEVEGRFACQFTAQLA